MIKNLSLSCYTAPPKMHPKQLSQKGAFIVLKLYNVINDVMYNVFYCVITIFIMVYHYIMLII